MKYKLKYNRLGFQAGDVVYDLTTNDYGSASMDSFLTQIPHISVTKDPNGGYPYITVALHDLETIDE